VAKQDIIPEHELQEELKLQAEEQKMAKGKGLPRQIEYVEVEPGEPETVTEEVSGEGTEETTEEEPTQEPEQQ
jgi:hypothetical protein